MLTVLRQIVCGHVFRYQDRNVKVIKQPYEYIENVRYSENQDLTTVCFSQIINVF